MKLNLLLLLAMVATNILSLYHLSSVRHPSTFGAESGDSRRGLVVPDHLAAQLHTIHAAITHLSHLNRQNNHPSTSSSPPPPPPELLIYSRLAPIASACSDHPDLLRRYMTYTPFSLCPPSSSAAAEPLILRGCHPLPRRRCFSSSPPRPPSGAGDDTYFSPLPDTAVLWPPSSSCRSFSCLSPSLGFDPAVESARFLAAKSPLDLTLFQLLNLARTHEAGPIRLALDVGGGTGTLAARLRQMANATVVTTTLNLGLPYSEAAALRGVVPLHVPLQQRFPVPDAALDLVRAGHAVNRWVPAPALEFLLHDADRVLRGGGLLWVDHFFCRAGDIEGVYGPMLGRLGYRTIKWAVGNKTDAGGVKFGEVYLTALLQKPKPKALITAGGGDAAAKAA